MKRNLLSRFSSTKYTPNYQELLRKNREVFKPTPYRWIILGLFALSTTSVSFAMMNFTSISETVADIYMVDDIVVNSCVLVFLISFILMNFFTVFALEYSINVTFKVCAIMTIIGVWLRWALIKYTANFYYLIIG